MINNDDFKSAPIGLSITSNPINFEIKTIEELQDFRENINITRVFPYEDGAILGYLIKMVDILLEKIEELEK